MKPLLLTPLVLLAACTAQPPQTDILGNWNLSVQTVPEKQFTIKVDKFDPNFSLFNGSLLDKDSKMVCRDLQGKVSTGGMLCMNTSGEFRFAGSFVGNKWTGTLKYTDKIDGSSNWQAPASMTKL